MLPHNVARFIDEQNVTDVVIVGGTAAVLGTSTDMVALVNRAAVADGIVAAPVMGRGLGDGGSVPILLVGDDLPAAVSDYLASTAEVRAGMKTHLSVVAVGGTAVVSKTSLVPAVALSALVKPRPRGQCRVLVN